MQMDQGTQQNAALVEQATSASQSMKQQAEELLRQVEFFKTDSTGYGQRSEPGGVARHERAGWGQVKGLLNRQNRLHCPQVGLSPQPCSTSPTGWGREQQWEKRLKRGR